jgi:phosphate starvation-inducible PhoH-like protein
MSVFFMDIIIIGYCRYSTMSTNEFQPLGETKKRRGKARKQHEKELMRDFNYENDDDNESSLQSQKRLYDNIQHLSSAEKHRLEEKFTKPKNGAQRDYHNLLSQRTKKIVVATGPAGTGKTLFATEIGVKNFLLGNVEKLIFTRPSVTVDEDLGYLPGTLEEKMAPWVRPIYDILYTFITPKEVTALIEDKIIEISPLGFMRGRTFKNCWIVADEMQNSTVSQMKMLLTRLGENTRLIITGDLDQPDRHEGANGLEDFLEKFKGKRSSSITSVEFDNKDIQREEVVREVLEIYGGEIPHTYHVTYDTSSTDEDGKPDPVSGH